MEALERAFVRQIDEMDEFAKYRLQREEGFELEYGKQLMVFHLLY
jgi:hypothetical protein